LRCAGMLIAYFRKNLWGLLSLRTEGMENMRLKYFLDVLPHPQARKMRQNLRGLVATKHPKNTFAAYFQGARPSHQRKSRLSYLGSGGAHDLDHQLEGFIKFSDQCDTTQMLL